MWAGARGSLSYLGAPLPPSALLNSFRQTFVHAHNRTPDDWAAYAYDCVLLLRAAATAQDYNSSAGGGALVDALRAARLYGMTGPIAFAPNRTSPSTHVRVTLQSLGGSEEVGGAPACCTALPPPRVTVGSAPSPTTRSPFSPRAGALL